MCLLQGCRVRKSGRRTLLVPSSLREEIPMPSRDATTHWEGGFQTGKGVVTLDSSNAGQFPVSFPTRAGDPEGQTSPEELIAAAHSACYAMSLSKMLEDDGHPSTTLDVSAEVTLGPVPGGMGITGIALTARGTAPGVDPAKFAEFAEKAKSSCPVSKALTGTTITLDAALDSA
jgi:osmotically inducible protein OsmC